MELINNINIDNYLVVYNHNNYNLSNIVYYFKDENIKSKDIKFCYLLKKKYKNIKYKNIYNFDNINDLNKQLNNDKHHRYYYSFFIDDFIEKINFNIIFKLLENDKDFKNNFILYLYEYLSNIYGIKNLILGLKSSIELYNYFLVKAIFNELNLSGKLYYFNNKFILTNEYLSGLCQDKKKINNKFNKYLYDYVINEEQNYDKELYGNKESNNVLISKNNYFYMQNDSLYLFLFFTENKFKYNLNVLSFDEFLNTLNSSYNLIFYDFNKKMIINKDELKNKKN